MANSPEALEGTSEQTIQTQEEGVSTAPQYESEQARFNREHADALGPHWKSYRRGGPGLIVGVGPRTLFSGLK